MKTDFITVSTDPVAADAVAADILGYDPGDVDTIRRADQMGLGTGDLKRITVQGRDEVGNFDFVLPRGAAALEQVKAPKVIAYGACARCRRALVNGIHACIDRHPEAVSALSDLTVVTGRPDTSEDLDGPGVLFYGNCTQYLGDQGLYEPGCPPLTGAVTTRLLELSDRIS